MRLKAMQRTSGLSMEGLRLVATVALLLTVPLAFAEYSIRLGVPLLGWERVESQSMVDLAQELGARQAGRFGYLCMQPETFIRRNSPSVMTALLFYTVPLGATEELLVEQHDLRVSRIWPADSTGARKPSDILGDGMKPDARSAAGDVLTPPPGTPATIVVISSANVDGTLLVTCAG